jgi:hypothetical protein
MRRLDGQKFGRLKVLSEAGRKFGGVSWLCRCDCGREHLVASGHLTNGSIRSCGCLRVDGPKTHGSCYKPEYRAFWHAKARCDNPRDSSYPNYGGRGIQFRFTSFEEWFAELGRRPAGMSVDRINNDGHYEPGNVRWATASQQAFNRRRKTK